MPVESNGSEVRYASMEGHWDEAQRASGFPRRHWRKLAVAVGRMGFRELSRCWQHGQQLIQARGFSAAGGELQGKASHTPVDPLPLVLAESEWAQIEGAVTQRAGLLNAILMDLYGERRLLSEGHFPPALLFANPRFLRPCHAIAPSGGVFLQTYAADLGRAPDGRWRVLADHTQTQPGIGYTLENRLVSARCLPDIFRQNPVRRLGSFFDARRNALLNLAARYRANPRVVLLTAGPNHKSYFEDSLLAGYWGFPLVEGTDLAARDNRVYLKTLAGLEAVDLIVLRVDHNLCDPLEMGGDASQGVPGLVQAVRSGTVALDNALGAGLLEMPAHLPFLSNLCRRLRAEELLMPSLATWWCGQEEARRYVLEHLDQLLIKPAFPASGRGPVFPASLSARAREELLHRIEAQPEQFTAQEQLALSTTPVRTESGFRPQQIVLRVFAAWDGQSYIVLPGGFTRVSPDGASLLASLEFDGGSKDTWVLGGSPEESALISQPVLPSSGANLSGPNLPSRVAENFFWLGRYAERVEAHVRLVRALVPALSGEEDFGRHASIDTVVRLLTELEHLPREISGISLGEQLWRVRRLLSQMVFDRTRSSSIGWNLKAMRRAFWHLRERLSPDTWRVLQAIESDFARAVPGDDNQRRLGETNLLDRVIVTLSALSGLLMENTTRGQGWSFLEIGRRLERTVQTVELLHSSVAETSTDVELYLQMLLHIADSAITYRTRYLTTLRADLVLELLLTDESNPRSVGFQLAALLTQIEKLPQPTDSGIQPLEELFVLQALAAVRMAQVSDLARPDGEGRLGSLDDLLQQLKLGMHDLSDALTARYLSHVAPVCLISSS